MAAKVAIGESLPLHTLRRLGEQCGMQSPLGQFVAAQENFRCASRTQSSPKPPPLPPSQLPKF